jgi:hypothetical protein
MFGFGGHFLNGKFGGNLIFGFAGEIWFGVMEDCRRDAGARRRALCGFAWRTFFGFSFGPLNYFAAGGGVTTDASFRIMPSDLLRT